MPCSRAWVLNVAVVLLLLGSFGEAWTDWPSFTFHPSEWELCSTEAFHSCALADQTCCTVVCCNTGYLFNEVKLPPFWVPSLCMSLFAVLTCAKGFGSFREPWILKIQSSEIKISSVNCKLMWPLACTTFSWFVFLEKLNCRIQNKDFNLKDLVNLVIINCLARWIPLFSGQWGYSKGLQCVFVT